MISSRKLVVGHLYYDTFGERVLKYIAKKDHRLFTFKTVFLFKDDPDRYVGEIGDWDKPGMKYRNLVRINKAIKTDMFDKIFKEEEDV